MQSSSLIVRFVVLLSCAVMPFAGCQSTRQTRSMATAATAADFEQTLAAGDVLRLQFMGAPDLSQSQRVRTDGKITLPMVGELSVAGKRPDVVRRELEALYKSKLQNSEVYVTVESSSASVYVSGAVNKAGKVVLDRPLTVLEAIMEAGGFARGLADTRRVQIIRKIDGKHQTLIVDLTKALKGQTTEVVYVQRYDVIQVPERWL